MLSFMTLELQRLAETAPLLATRAAGLDALADWRRRVPSYGRQRNVVFEGHPHVSRLSRFLSHRLLLEEEVLGSLLEEHTPEAIAKFIEEVCWRTYWKGWLEQHPKVWEDYRRSVASLETSLPDELKGLLERARAGRTGLECFDEWVRELLETGYLHNHARMWFASIWIFTLRLPWQLGAAFFLRHLLDGDAAANTLSWRWVAGLHTPGKPYVARAENIARYTQGRFNPAGALNEDPAPLSEDSPCDGIPLRRCESSRASRYPDLSESPAGLLVTAEDLVPEHGVLGEAPFHSIAVLAPANLFRVEGYSARVRAFKTGALRDAALRAARHWGGTLLEPVDPEELAAPPAVSSRQVGVHAPMRVYGGEVEDWTASVLAWARAEHLRAIRLLEPPVGPWRDRLDGLRTALRRHGILLKCYRRRWDELHWPHATRGFFAFRRGLHDRLASFLAEHPVD